MLTFKPLMRLFEPTREFDMNIYKNYFTHVYIMLNTIEVPYLTVKLRWTV